MHKNKLPAKQAKRLDLNSYDVKLKDISRLQQDLQGALSDRIFTFTSMQELHYEALRIIKPLHLSVKQNEASIREGIICLLQHFRLLGKSVIVRKFTVKRDAPAKVKEQDPIDIFQKWVLGFDKLPSVQLQQLMSKTEEDLRGVNKLVRKYEQLPEVAAFLSGKETTRNHRSKTILDFYKRCLAERQVILDYYLEGVYDRALEKSRPNWLGLQDWGNFLGLKDYPYRFGNPYLTNTFDFETIDCSSHRVGDVSDEQALGYRVLYRENKEKFYRKLFKHRPADYLFSSMEFHRGHIPAVKNRDAIFKELQRLFKTRRWVAFYALALPQVEGLFAEMVAASNPDAHVLQKALPDKVRSVRPNYLLSDDYLDYYEYVLPEKRNSFMHSGYADDIKLNAFDLLTDLEHVLTVFSELNDPLVKLNRILKRRSCEDFVDFKQYATYFTLLKRIHDKKKKEKETEVENFNREFLAQHCAAEFVAHEAAQLLLVTVGGLLNGINSRFRSSELFSEFEAQREHDLRQKLEAPEMREIAADFFVYHRDSVQTVFTLRDFFMGMQEYLVPHLDHQNGLLAEALEVWNTSKKTVKKLEVMYQKLEKP